jgi:hypothetical protein
MAQAIVDMMMNNKQQSGGKRFISVPVEEEERFKALVKELENQKIQFYDEKDVHVKQTEEEKRRKRREYRRRYRNLPEVRKKREERNKLPEIIQKRREYSARPGVKQRKKFLARRRRLAFRLLERQHEELAKRYFKQADEFLADYTSEEDEQKEGNSSD